MADKSSSRGEFPSPEPHRPSDADLLASVRKAKPDALGALYDRYSAIIMAVCLRIISSRSIAEKIVEDIFYDLWRHPDPTQGPLVNRLVAQARSSALKCRQSLSPELDTPADYSGESETDEFSTDTPDLRWQRERARAALVKLPAEARKVIEMSYLNAWNIDQVASRLNRSVQDIRAILAGGMRAFQDALQSIPPATTPLNEPGFSSVRLDRVRVLIVDDEPDARRVLTFALQAVGALVTAATSVAEAMMLLPTANPDVLLSDLAMPAEDGFDLIRKVRRAGRTARDLPAIALTAFATGQIRRDVIRAGFQMHVPKPVDPHQLAEVVASLAGRIG